MTSAAYQSIRQYTFGDLLREHRRSRPAVLAAVDGATRLTYRELDAEVNRVATALSARGVQTGDRLLWLGQNSVHIVTLLGAAAKIGAVVCPANWRNSGSEILRLIADFDPKVVFWQERGVADAGGHARVDPVGRSWVQVDGTGNDSYAALVASGEDADDERAIDSTEPLLAIYTAAFDGAPHAAMLSHDAVLLQALLSARNQAIEASTVYLVSGPMFHLGVLVGMFGTLLSGGRNVFVARIDALEMLETIHAERPTHGFVPKPVVAGIREANVDRRFDVTSMFEQPDLSDWTSTVVMPRHASRRRFPGGYGQTEISGLAVHAEADAVGGRPAPFLQVRIVDEAAREVPVGSVGEIAVRGPLVMCGYYGHETENDRRSRDGWHRTHDLGIRREDGSITFVGPKTTMIKTGVENVYPEEVESCLRLHEAVADVCVIGVPDPEWDQSVKAIIKLRDGMSATAEELTGFCRLHIASYKKPKQFSFVTQIARLPDGRLDRAAADLDHGGGGYPSYAA